MSYKYEYHTEPYQHQRDILNKTWSHQYYALHLDMGTGKSKIVIDNAAALYETGGVQLVIVVTLNGVHSNWARIEIPKHLPPRIPRHIFEWNAYQAATKSFQNENEAFKAEKKSLRWLCINISSFSRQKSKALSYVLEVLKTANDRTMMVLDESSCIKDPKTNQSKNLIRVAQYAMYRRTLTGTPITEAPFNIWPQSEFLARALTGHKSYSGFCNRYGVYEIMHLGPHRKFRQLKHYRRLEELRESMKNWSIEMRKDQCLDLPEKVYEIHRFLMTAEQAEAYDEMLQMGNLRLPDGRTVSAAENALVRRGKLYQITLGYVKCDDDSIYWFDHNRLDALHEVLQEIGNSSCIIYSHSRPCLEEIYQDLCSRVGAENVSLYWGDTPSGERIDQVKNFQDKKVRYFVANQQVAGFGLTLTQADYVIYYSNMFSLERRLQSEDRALRIGRINNVTYIDLMCDGSVDDHVVDSLRDKVDLAKTVMSLAINWLDGHKKAFNKRRVTG